MIPVKSEFSSLVCWSCSSGWIETWTVWWSEIKSQYFSTVSSKNEILWILFQKNIIYRILIFIIKLLPHLCYDSHTKIFQLMFGCSWMRHGKRPDLFGPLYLFNVRQRQKGLKFSSITFQALEFIKVDEGLKIYNSLFCRNHPHK